VGSGSAPTHRAAYQGLRGRQQQEKRRGSNPEGGQRCDSSPSPSPTHRCRARPTAPLQGWSLDCPYKARRPRRRAESDIKHIIPTSCQSSNDRMVTAKRPGIKIECSKIDKMRRAVLSAKNDYTPADRHRFSRQTIPQKTGRVMLEIVSNSPRNHRGSRGTMTSARPDHLRGSMHPCMS